MTLKTSANLGPQQTNRPSQVSSICDWKDEFFTILLGNITSFNLFECNNTAEVPSFTLHTAFQQSHLSPTNVLVLLMSTNTGFTQIDLESMGSKMVHENNWRVSPLHSGTLSSTRFSLNFCSHFGMSEWHGSPRSRLATLFD